MPLPKNGLASIVGATVFTVSMCAGGAPVPEDPSVLAAARTLGVEGVKLADAGNCPDAIDRLEHAERLHHAPTTLGRLGECYVAVGQLVRGSELLQRVVREPLGPDSPPPFSKARARAQRVLDEARPQIGKLRVIVETIGGAPATAAPEIRIDGETTPSSLLEVDRPTDPGAHEVFAHLPGYADVSQAVTIAPGERVELRLVLTPLLEPTGEPTSVPVPESTRATQVGTWERPREPRVGPKAGVRTYAGVALISFGAAAIATGGVFGVLALGTKADLDDACDQQKACPTGYDGSISRLKTQATISSVGFAVGGIAALSGVIVLLTDRGRPGPAPSSSTLAKVLSTVDVTTKGSPGVMLRGRF